MIKAMIRRRSRSMKVPSLECLRFACQLVVEHPHHPLLDCRGGVEHVLVLAACDVDGSIAHRGQRPRRDRSALGQVGSSILPNGYNHLSVSTRRAHFLLSRAISGAALGRTASHVSRERKDHAGVARRDRKSAPWRPEQLVMPWSLSRFRRWSGLRCRPGWRPGNSHWLAPALWRTSSARPESGSGVPSATHWSVRPWRRSLSVSP